MSTKKIIKELIEEQNVILQNPESSKEEQELAMQNLVKLVNVQGEYLEKTCESTYEPIKILLNGAGFIMNMAFMTIWMNKGFKFEQEGVFSSFTFKKLIGDIKKK